MILRVLQMIVLGLLLSCPILDAAEAGPTREHSAGGLVLGAGEVGLRIVLGIAVLCLLSRQKNSKLFLVGLSAVALFHENPTHGDLPANGSNAGVTLVGGFYPIGSGPTGASALR